MKERLIREIGHEFTIISVLGKGAFGTVMECLNLSSNKNVALKIIKKYRLTEKQIHFSIQESELLRNLNHPNIVTFIGLHHTDSFLILEMELLQGKSLADLLHSRTLNEEEAASIMRMIFQAVSYLHKVHVLHRDLKPENIMFQDKEFKTLKITDFGLSTKYSLEERLNARSGTMAYMAPEQIIQKQYSEPIDIWSCGIILYILLTNTHPLNFKRDDLQSYIQNLQNIEWKFPENFPPLARDLFLRCTRINALERYSANLALRHPWITRTRCKIPMTPLEEVRNYQDMLKLKKIVIASLQLVGIVPCLKIQERYIRRIRDPGCEDIILVEETPKKNHSVANIDLKISQKSIKNSRQVSVSYGKYLCIPGKKDITASSSPREKGREGCSSKSISRSPSPRPMSFTTKIAPKTANHHVRSYQIDN